MRDASVLTLTSMSRWFMAENEISAVNLME